MRNRRKVGAFLALVLAMIGLVAFSPMSQAKPAAGTWEVQRQCAPSMGAVNGTNTSFDGTIKFKYRLDFVEHQPSPGGRDKFTFTLLSASYIGDNYQTGYPSLNVTSSGGWSPVYVTAQNGTNPVTPNNYLFGNAPTSPQFLAAGVSPAVSPAWTSQTLYYPDGGPPNNVLRLNFGNQSAGTNPCIFYIDMSNPDAPDDYMVNQVPFSCQPTSQPAASAGDDITIRYTLFKLNPGEFTIQLTGVEDYIDAGPLEGFTDALHVTVYSGSQSSSLDPVGGMGIYHRNGNNEWNGPTTDFPVVTLPYILGQSAPYIQVTGTPNGCSNGGKYYLGTNWGVPGQSYSNTVSQEFNDCSGMGQVNIQSFWEWDANSRKVRIKRISITNDSDTRLQMPTLIPGQTLYNNPAYRSDAGSPTVYYSDASSIVSRNINPHTVREFDVGGSYWNMISGSYGAPSLLTLDVDKVPVMEFSFRAQRPDGSLGWVSCETTIWSTLEHIEATSLRL